MWSETEKEQGWALKCEECSKVFSDGLRCPSRWKGVDGFYESLKEVSRVLFDDIPRWLAEFYRAVPVERVTEIEKYVKVPELPFDVWGQEHPYWVVRGVIDPSYYVDEEGEIEEREPVVMDFHAALKARNKHMFKDPDSYVMLQPVTVDEERSTKIQEIC